MNKRQGEKQAEGTSSVPSLCVWSKFTDTAKMNNSHVEGNTCIQKRSYLAHYGALVQRLWVHRLSQVRRCRLCESVRFTCYGVSSELKKLFRTLLRNHHYLQIHTQSAMDDPDFNSSDIEMGEPPPNPWAHLGKKATDSMAQTAQEDRVQSKRESKLLSHGSGAPGTVSGRQAWVNEFEAFCGETLKHE